MLIVECPLHCVQQYSLVTLQINGGPSRKDRGVMNLALDHVPELDFKPLCDSILGWDFGFM